MRTTIDLPDSMFREVKTRAVQQGTTLKTLVAKYIEAGLRGQAPPPPPKRRQRSPLPVAIERNPGVPLTRAFTNEDLNTLLEDEDLENVRRVLRQSPARDT